MKDQILYIFDPLCGWCYGFSDTMFQFYKEHHNTYEFVAVPGGMVTGSSVGPIAEMEAYIAQSYSQVEQTTGVTFGKNYLDGLLRSKTTEMNSEPPSRALLTFRSFHFDRVIEFAHALQYMHYSEGKDYNNESLYREMAQEFGIDPNEFMDRFDDDGMKAKTQQEFAWVKEAGIKGFPTVVYRSNDNYYLLAHGYANQKTLNDTLSKAMELAKTESGKS